MGLSVKGARMIFLFTEIDHPAMFKDRGTPDADHILASQLFLIEEILFKHGVLWMKRTPTGVLSAFDAGEPAKAAIALEKEFENHLWEGYDKAKIRKWPFCMRAKQKAFGQAYVGPDLELANQKLVGNGLWGPGFADTSRGTFHSLPWGDASSTWGPIALKDLSRAPKYLRPAASGYPLTASHQPLHSLRHYLQQLFFPRPLLFMAGKRRSKKSPISSPNPRIRLGHPAGPTGGFRQNPACPPVGGKEVVEKFKDTGVYLVALAPLLSDQLMVGSIANAIKFFFYGAEDPKTQLLNHLREKEMLLLMDNFEHIIEGAELVSEMLREGRRG